MHVKAKAGEPQKQSKVLLTKSLHQNYNDILRSKNIYLYLPFHQKVTVESYKKRSFCSFLLFVV